MRAPIRRRPFPAVAAALAACLLLLGCSGEDDTVAVSEDGSSTTAASRGAASEAYCTTADELASQPSGLDLSQDAAGALAGIEQLAADAPASLQGDFDTFLEGVRGVADLGEDDPDALSAVFELMTDPEFAAAATAIEDYTSAECGVELGANVGADSTGADSESTPAREPGEIQLEDIDAVKDANGSAAWTDKLSTTVINGLADVQVSSSGDDLTEAEAMAACTALMTGLAPFNAEVTVAVANGDEVLAEGADGTCTAA